jgi:tetratricopeptide (TPR) repeat protein
MKFSNYYVQTPFNFLRPFQIIEWLKEYKDAITSLSIIVGGGWAVWVWRKKQGGNSSAGIQNQNSPNLGKQINAPVTANGHATVNQHFGLSFDDAMKLAEKLAAEKGEKDAQVIKSLQETIQALTLVNTKKYDINKAFELLDQGDTTQAEAIFAGVAAEARQAGKEASISEAEALRHLGSLAFLHDTQKAFIAYKRSTELDPESLDGWNQLGHLYRRIGELEKAENAYRTLQKLSLLQQNREGEAAALGNLGIVYQVCGDLERAIEYHEESLAIEKKLGRKESIANDYGNLGNVYRIRGELDRAIEYHEKSLTIEKELGRKEGMASDYGNLGNVYQIRGDLNRAIDYYEKSLALNRELGRKEGMASDYGNLGNVYRICGELDCAIEYHEKSLTIEKELRRKEGMANQYGNLGNVYQIRGDLEHASDCYEKSLALNQELRRKEGMASDYGNLGNVYRIRGELERAIKYHEKSLDSVVTRL